MLLEGVKVDVLIQFFLIFFVAFVGSFAKDYLDLINCKGKMSFTRTILSTFTASLIVFCFADYIEGQQGRPALMLASFFTGLIGFQILTRMSTIDGAMQLIGDLIGLFKDITDLISKRSSKQDDTHQKVKEKDDN